MRIRFGSFPNPRQDLEHGYSVLTCSVLVWMLSPHLVSLFVLFCCCLLETCFFFWRRNGGRGKVEKTWEEWMQGKLWSGCIMEKKNPFSIKKWVNRKKENEMFISYFRKASGYCQLPIFSLILFIYLLLNNFLELLLNVFFSVFTERVSL